MAPTEDDIVLDVPAQPHLVRMVRLAVISAVPAEILDLDSLADLRLATSEAFGVTVGRKPRAGRVRVNVQVREDDRHVQVTIRSDQIVEDTTLTERVLGACCDTVTIRPEGQITFTKRLA